MLPEEAGAVAGGDACTAGGAAGVQLEKTLEETLEGTLEEPQVQLEDPLVQREDAREETRGRAADADARRAAGFNWRGRPRLVHTHYDVETDNLDEIPESLRDADSPDDSDDFEGFVVALETAEADKGLNAEVVEQRLKRSRWSHSLFSGPHRWTSANACIILLVAGRSSRGQLWRQTGLKPRMLGVGMSPGSLRPRAGGQTC